jgi:protein-S-isoprenylcysteine O-methyltransferase Ste14
MRIPYPVYSKEGSVLARPAVQGGLIAFLSTHRIRSGHRTVAKQSEPLSCPAAAQKTAPAGSGNEVPELNRCICSYTASMTVILAGVYFYTALSPYYIALYRLSWRPMLAGRASSITIDLPLALWFFTALYAAALLPYYAVRRGHWSNAWTLMSYLWRRCGHWRGSQRHQPASKPEKQAMLCLLLKFIFIPFCIHGLVAYLAYTNDQLIGIPDLLKKQDLFALYNNHLHPFILNIIFLVDFFPFVVGYLVQTRVLDNEVVSVDASTSGWLACMVCYPPFNVAMAALLPWQVLQVAPVYPTFSATAHLVVNGVMLAFFSCYAWASVSLGFKCGNLMHRGIVHSGLYRNIRHPAYLFKNLAWWTGALPLLVGLAQTSAKGFFWFVFCLGGWSAVYVLRAICEERHLSRHADYRDYMKRVPYRFIPGVF